MTMSETKLKYFADYIESQLGIQYSPAVYFQLEQRLVKIAEFVGLKTVDELHAKVLHEGITGDLKQFLLDTATNNETSFFRDPKVFRALETLVFPSLPKLYPKNFSYRFWCAASSFGQEPYSVAILAYEFLQKNPGHARIEILGTDIADHALARCKEAKYSQLEVQRGLTAQRMVAHFTKGEGDYWTLQPQIKALVDFKKQNLLDPFVGLGMFQVILCRYVLIYQDAERKKAIVQKLEKCLSPGGYLILGASESALGLSSDLNQLAIDGAILYQKKGSP